MQNHSNLRYQIPWMELICVSGVSSQVRQFCWMWSEAAKGDLLVGWWWSASPNILRPRATSRWPKNRAASSSRERMKPKGDMMWEEEQCLKALFYTTKWSSLTSSILKWYFPGVSASVSSPNDITNIRMRLYPDIDTSFNSNISFRKPNHPGQITTPPKLGSKAASIFSTTLNSNCRLPDTVTLA